MSLEERLKEILAPLQQDVTYEALLAAVSATIQAFKDEGFQKYMEEWPRMTGQEWYDRFEKEYMSLGYEEFLIEPNVGKLTLEAAKKAAGL